MKMDDTKPHDMTTIRSLATHLEADKLARCLKEQIENGHNSCYADADNEHVINVLAKVRFVKQLETKGLSIPGAIRELARRMRFAQGKSA
jgi:hypothetical protein